MKQEHAIALPLVWIFFPPYSLSLDIVSTRAILQGHKMAASMVFGFMSVFFRCKANVRSFNKFFLEFSLDLTAKEMYIKQDFAF